MVGLSQLRFAAGVCVLAAGLLIAGAGGAVAVADPGSRDPSGSAAHGDNGTSASGQQPKKPKKTKKGGTKLSSSSVMVRWIRLSAHWRAIDQDQGVVALIRRVRQRDSCR